MVTAAGRVGPPSAATVGDLLSELLPGSCTVTPAGPLDLDPDVPTVVAGYVDPSRDVVAVAIADLALACRAGSALVMTPPEEAEAAIGAGAIDPDTFDCFTEVLRVLARALNAADGPHVRAGSTYRSGSLLPGGIRRVLGGSGLRQGYRITIDGYGEGHLCIVEG